MYKVSNTRSVRTSAEMCGRRYFGVRDRRQPSADMQRLTATCQLQSST